MALPEHALNGFSIVRGLISTEVIAGIRHCVTSEFGSILTATLPEKSNDPYSSAFFSRSNLWQRLDKIKELWLTGPLPRHVCALFNATELRLSHDHLFWKRSGNTPTPVHADQFGIPLAACRLLTAWVPLQEVSKCSGSLFYYKTPTNTETLDHAHLGNLSQPELISYLNDRCGPAIETADFEPGDVAFHDGWAYHGAFANTTQDDRIAIAVTYFSIDGVICCPASGNSAAAISERYYGGIPVGSPPSAATNPFTSW